MMFNEFDDFWTELFSFYKNTVNEKLIQADIKKKKFCSEEQKCLKRITILGICQLNEPSNLDINKRLRDNLEKYNNLLKYQCTMLSKDDTLKNANMGKENQILESFTDKNQREGENLNEYVVYEAEKD